MDILKGLLQCGAFIIVPTGIILIGLWVILRYIGSKNRYAIFLYALLIGIAFFAASFIGMLSDPRSTQTPITEIIKTSAIIAIIATIAILCFTMVFKGLIKIFRKLFTRLK